LLYQSLSTFRKRTEEQLERIYAYLLNLLIDLLQAVYKGTMSERSLGVIDHQQKEVFRKTSLD